MQRLDWDPLAEPAALARDWCRAAACPGILHAVFDSVDRSAATGNGVPWMTLERWRRCRAVTVADVRCDLTGPALDMALCSDLVCLHARAVVRPDPGEPTAGWLYALGRAGRAALARGLLDTAPIPADEALALGLAHRVIEDGASAPLPGAGSLTALTIARDLMRASVSGGGYGLQLELASFRLLFASGDPGEGARAFLERRDPRFD